MIETTNYLFKTNYGFKIIIIYLAGILAVRDMSIMLIILIFSQITKHRNSIKSKEIYRELNEKYTPAMASYLIDISVEEGKDILATILDLNVRKYLTYLKDDNNELKIKFENKNIDNLYIHEKYIINQIKNNELINPKEFSNRVKEDCIKEGLIKEKDNNIFDIIILSTFILSPVIGLIFGKAELGSFLFIICIIMILLRAGMDFDRTKKGKKASLKYKGLKNYLKEYTLVKTRDVEYINILDN